MHGDAFRIRADASASLESIPITADGVYGDSVGYQPGRTHRFPAATKDVVAVYRALVKTYRLDQIGIYGGSAGDGLSAEVAALLPVHGLLETGAICVLGSGAVYAATDDATFIAACADGSSPPTTTGSSPEAAAPPISLESISRAFGCR